ncbi:hypothetical protein RHMOL_Rhmol07G0194800 [Rhododendron molle]|uniref:Uncharacterized protein n=1 Tax=Rhododendron molle TaxID=49168 RepID=A0ACC0N3Y1_RHOML|nr:hypothetical protein RHMOL_Rhmol07G0194800 [Rhododendron molle]
MAEKQPMSEMERKPEEKLTSELIMYLMSPIRQTLYKVENEPRYEVHPQSCLKGVSDPFMLTPSDIAELFNESEDSGSQTEEEKKLLIPPRTLSKRSQNRWW